MKRCENEITLYRSLNNEIKRALTLFCRDVRDNNSKVISETHTSESSASMSGD